MQTKYRSDENIVRQGFCYVFSPKTYRFFYTGDDPGPAPVES